MKEVEIRLAILNYKIGNGKFEELPLEVQEFIQKEEKKKADSRARSLAAILSIIKG